MSALDNDRAAAHALLLTLYRDDYCGEGSHTAECDLVLASIVTGRTLERSGCIGAAAEGAVIALAAGYPEVEVRRFMLDAIAARGVA